MAHHRDAHSAPLSLCVTEPEEALQPSSLREKQPSGLGEEEDTLLAGVDTELRATGVAIIVSVWR